MNIPLSIPSINSEDIQNVTEVLESGLLIQGIKVETFEKQFLNYVKGNYAAATSNGTSTLHLALLGLGIEPGDEVIVPAFSFMATANVVELIGATPVFVDIDLETFNIDAKQITNKITERTKAIIPVHEFGLACDIEQVMIIARKHNLVVIEDAACAFGATFNGKAVGTFGNAGSYSFHPRKAITSGEGGILVVEDLEVYEKIKVLRNHGIANMNGRIEFVAPGFNYRLTDIQAALLIGQLSRFNTMLERRSDISRIYFNEIRSERVRLPVIPQFCNHAWQTFHLLMDDSVDRNKMISDLNANGIGSNYGAQCMPAQKFYQDKYQLDCDSLFPNAMKAYKSGLAIPMYGQLSDADALKVAHIINSLLEN